MAGESASVGAPLRTSDPTQLGEYRIVRLLGEGGMGCVYLAESAAGRTVALKVIRADLANEPEFRRRFRGEVARAREVPPFCTAEVLDAAPDHETPYLVVEYVDGPSLADVVRDRGPLTPANLHGLAIGVATALTAIHGAGVIHRDLKPSNVLLAPGAPKVIDFGIARAAVPDNNNPDTSTDQLIGTVAYMAPERLDPGVRRTLTPAADVFAWGAVVAYAATGHGAFDGSSPPATAVAILTKAPNLDGIAEPLRGLVERALAKNPKARPTARELLDELLSNPLRTGPPRPMVPTPDSPWGESDQTTAHVDTGAALNSGLAQAYVDVDDGPAPPTTVIRPTKSRPAPPPHRSRWRGLGVAALILLVIASAGTLAGIVSGVIQLPKDSASGPPPSPSASAPSTPSPTVSTAGPSGPVMPAGFPYLAVHDPLTSRVRWRATSDTNFHISCAFSPTGLQVTLTSIARTKTWRCSGPADKFGDFQVTTTVTLVTPGSCAGIWFHFQGNIAGYAVQVCASTLAFGTHAGSTLTTLEHYDFPTPLAIGMPVRLSVVGHGQTFTVAQCRMATTGCPEPTVLLQKDAITFPVAGTVQLGIFEPDEADPALPYHVAFADVDITAPLPPTP